MRVGGSQGLETCNTMKWWLTCCLFFFAARLETTSKSNSLLSLAVFLLFVLLAAKRNFIPFHLISPTCAVSFLLLYAKRFTSRCSWWKISKFPLYYFHGASVLCNPSNINFPKYLWIKRERGQEREGGRVIMSRRANWMRMWLFCPSSPQLTDVSHTSLVTSY